MGKYILLKEDVRQDGELAFEAGKKYKVHSNGTSSIHREFVLSDLTKRGSSLFSLAADFEEIYEIDEMIRGNYNECVGKNE